MPLDEIGDWSETKLAIIREYAPAYTQIVRAQKNHFHYVYFDVLAGSGLDKSRKTGEIVGAVLLLHSRRTLDLKKLFH